MKTALAILATGEYEVGARVMFSTLRKRGGLPDSVDCYAIGPATCDFAIPLPIQEDYSWVKVNEKNFPRVADKFQALLLSYDRIILMDADMLCVGDCSYLWSEDIGEIGFYACRDTASVIYYPGEIKEIGLNPSRIFNAGTMVFQMNVLGGGFHSHLMGMIQQGLRAYDGGDQGYLNAYFQQDHQDEISYLPPEYNELFDVNMPTLPPHARRVLHFTGANAKPWNPKLHPSDLRWPWVRRWREELKDTL